jgi:hypothetical protein
MTLGHPLTPGPAGSILSGGARERVPNDSDPGRLPCSSDWERRREDHDSLDPRSRLPEPIMRPWSSSGWSPAVSEAPSG